MQRMDNVIDWINLHPVDNNHLMTVPKGNSEICFPKTLGTLRLSLFTSQRKLEKNTVKNFFYLTLAASQIFCGFKERDLVTCKSKVQGVSKFCSPKGVW